MLRRDYNFVTETFDWLVESQEENIHAIFYSFGWILKMVVLYMYIWLIYCLSYKTKLFRS